jgi:3-oxoacyl-[acyl-carrier protein] reductase
MNDKIRRYMPEDQQRSLAASYAVPRLGEPGDVAAAALFLSSDASSWITGIVLDVAGGKVML